MMFPARFSDHRLNIMIIGIDADVVRVGQALSEIDGYTVSLMASAAQALAVDADFATEVCIIELGLPGPSEQTLVKHLRRAGRRVDPCLIAVTQEVQRFGLQRSMAAGFDLHLTKPFEPAVIIDFIAGRCRTGDL
jgi:CheY-like chemotaxis protein